VGLITGSFDVLHVGHVNLIRSAKRHVDILVIGVEGDEFPTSKSFIRPMRELDLRCEVLSELSSVDLVFPVEFVIEYEPSDKNDRLYRNMYQKINPDFLITNPITDSFWSLKLKRAEKMGIGFLALRSNKSTS